MKLNIIFKLKYQILLIISSFSFDLLLCCVPIKNVMNHFEKSFDLQTF